MAIGSPSRVPRHLQTLFDSGPAGDLADGVLLERFVAARDEAAFEVLVARHGPMVLQRLPRRAGRPRRGRRRVPGGLPRPGPAGRVDPVAGVDRELAVRRRVAGLGPRAGRGRPPPQARTRAVSAEKPAAAPADFDDRPDPAPLLHEELARLPDRYREAIVLCYFEGHTCDAAARRLRRPVGTVKARLSRARGMLRQRLIRRGVALPAGLLAAGIACRCDGGRGAGPGRAARG